MGRVFSPKCVNYKLLVSQKLYLSSLLGSILSPSLVILEIMKLLDYREQRDDEEGS